MFNFFRNIEDLFVNLQVYVYSSVHSQPFPCTVGKIVGGDGVMDFLIFNRFKCTNVYLVLGLQCDESVKF